MWTLLAWSHITGMPHEERGLALALSLGGQAGKVARAFPHAMLNNALGLSRLVQALEREFGGDLQDRTRKHMKVFDEYSRSKGTNLSQHTMMWELLFNEAQNHGLQMNLTACTNSLLRKANLSQEEEDKILVQVNYV